MMSQEDSDVIWVMVCIPHENGGFKIKKWFCKRGKLTLRPPTSAIAYGRSGFGGMRIRLDKHGKPYIHYCRTHCRRLRYNAKSMGILKTEIRPHLPNLNMDYEEIEKIIMDLYARNGKGDFTYVRPTIYREFGGLGVSQGVTGFVFMIEIVPFWDGAYYGNGSDKGMKVVAVNPEEFSRPTFASQTRPAKSGGVGTYVVGGDAKDWAHAHGFDDALMQSPFHGDFYVSDFTSTNIICLKSEEKALYLPESNRMNFLNGIQQQICLRIAEAQGWNLHTKNIALNSLGEYDEILATGTAGGVGYVSEIGFYNSEETLHYKKGAMATHIIEEFNRGILERIEYNIEKMF